MAKVPKLPSDRSGYAPKTTGSQGIEEIPQSGAETAQCLELSTKDGVRHFVRVWHAQAEGPLIIHLHGIEGHSRWFESTAVALKQMGISTFAIDRRGAGNSSEKRETSQAIRL